MTATLAGRAPAAVTPAGLAGRLLALLSRGPVLTPAGTAFTRAATAATIRLPTVTLRTASTIAATLRRLITMAPSRVRTTRSGPVIVVFFGPSVPFRSFTKTGFGWHLRRSSPC